MTPDSADFYSPREIAAAAGVSEPDVIAALGGVRGFLGHDDAVRLGRHLAAAARRAPVAAPAPASVPATVAGVSVKAPGPLFSLFTESAATRRSAGVPLAVSSTLHAGAIAFAVFLATFNLAPRAASLVDDPVSEPMRLVFVATPGPGGGGGGGGLRRPRPKRCAKGAAPSAARCRCAASRNRSSRCPRRRSRSRSRR